MMRSSVRRTGGEASLSRKLEGLLFTISLFESSEGDHSVTIAALQKKQVEMEAQM